MKLIKRENIHIEVYAEIPWIVAKGSEEEARALYRDCEALATQIRRHCDNVQSVRVVENRKTVCSFCNSDWEDYMDNEKPWCCDEAQAEWREKFITKE